MAVTSLRALPMLLMVALGSLGPQTGHQALVNRRTCSAAAASIASMAANWALEAFTIALSSPATPPTPPTLQLQLLCEEACSQL
eukprot:CAMPEP_0181533850 /NCGR_PEP_ID=MMETSP1110-20121109/73389_1 /TAXON_ID=174948 /ORGANISM="Symbiodinium sp., Strain CCMP421" /LENGTH=83 /DNA_ID=CAMNT_0023665085 /DNA_START=53 /DNA_END=305 /DNA_ORIENTATION=+